MKHYSPLFISDRKYQGQIEITLKKNKSQQSTIQSNFIETKCFYVDKLLHHKAIYSFTLTTCFGNHPSGCTFKRAR